MWHRQIFFWTGAFVTFVFIIRTLRYDFEKKNSIELFLKPDNSDDMINSWNIFRRKFLGKPLWEMLYDVARE